MTSDVGVCSRMMPGYQAAVGGRHVGHGVVPAHGGAGVQDVFEDVVGIGAVRAGQLGADVAAGVEELVARQARAVKNGPAARGSRRRILQWKRALTCTWSTRAALVFDVGWTLPQTASSRARIRGSAKASNWRATETLTSRRGRSRARRHPEARAPSRGGRPAWRSRRRARARCSCRNGSRRSRAWRDRRRPPAPAAPGPRNVGSSTRPCRSAASPGTRRSTRADRARCLISSGVSSVSNNALAARELPWDHRGRGPAGGPVPRDSGRVAPEARTSASGQPSGRATCLRPRRPSWVPIKRSTQALSLGPLEQRDDRGQAGRRVGLDGAAGHESAHDRNLRSRCERHGPPLVGRHQRLDAIPDHQGEHRVGRVFLVARQRFSDRPALCSAAAAGGPRPGSA